MIDRKLQEYALLLEDLYGSGVYLQRLLALSLTFQEQDYLTGLIKGKSNSKLVFEDGEVQSDSIRRAKSRLLEKLDSVILANPPIAVGSRRVEVTRDAFAFSTAAAMARRTGLMTLAKHKLLAVAREAVPPDMYEVRLFALRMLVSIAAHDADNAEYKRYRSELHRCQDNYNTIIAIDEVFRHLILQNLKKYNRVKGLQRVAVEALEVLNDIDLKTCDSIIVIAGCTLATAVAQVVVDKDLAETWLTAYVDACIELDLWDDAHKRDWLQQQINICEYFGHHKGMTVFSKQLIELTKSGTERWFQLMNSLSARALSNNNIKLSVQLTMDALAHPRLRRQRLDVKSGLLYCAGYASVVSGNEQLYSAYRRRRKQRDPWYIHAVLIQAMHAVFHHDLLEALTAFEHALTLFSTKQESEDVSSDLRVCILDILQQLRKIETLPTERKQRAMLGELRPRMSSQILPIVMRLI